MKFRKKPLVIDAIQWQGNFTAIQIWMANNRAFRIWEIANNALMIQTLEGDMRANYGDWIIRGIKGEVYPIKDDIFEATYEKVLDIPEVKKPVVSKFGPNHVNEVGDWVNQDNSLFKLPEK